MLQKVENFISKHQMLQVGDKIVVGVSGGADSLALLHILLYFKKDYGLELVVVHLNHQLRDQEGKRDADFVADLARRWGITAFIESADVLGYAKDKKLSIETAAREIRYQLYQRIAKTTQASKIALGHHADDQVETILMRILRGAGEEGLAGISPVRDNIIRPLLNVTKGEIELYCRENDLNYCLDATNLETVYLRNKIRLELLPLLEKDYNGNIKQTLLRLGTLAREDANYWSQYCQEILQEIIVRSEKNGLILEWKKITSYHSAVQRRLIREAIRKVQGNVLNVGFDRLEEIRIFFLSSPQGKKILPSGLILEKSYGQLAIYQEEEISYSYSLQIPGINILEDLNLTIRTQVIDQIPPQQNLNPRQFYLSFNPSDGPLVIRNRREGDWFSPHGARGSKKIKDYFIDAKVPRFLRDKIPLLAQKNQVFWIIGQRLGKSEKKEVNLFLEAELLGERGIKYE